MGLLFRATRRPRFLSLLALTLAAAAAAAAAVTAIVNPTGVGAPVRTRGRRRPRGRGAARNVKGLRGRGALRIRRGRAVSVGEGARGGEFLVKFFLPDGDSFYCAGSLTGKVGNKVVTAAHCFEGSDASADIVRIGGVALFDGFEAGIESVTMHPNYDPDTFANDIAVVTLRGSPSRRELRRLGVFPVTLNKSTRRPRNQEPVTLTGWGASSGKTGEVKVTPELAVTRMKVNPYQRCIKYLTRREIDVVGLDKDIMICASLRDTTSSCSGDSGGPMFREVDNRRRRPKWILYGVLSFGHSDGDGDSCPVENPEWYTRVSAYHTWLKDLVDA